MSSNIDSILGEKRLFHPPHDMVEHAVSSGVENYKALGDEAERDVDGFWGRLANEHIRWRKPFTKILNDSQAPFYTWFEDGQLNVSENCLDVHLENGNADKVALIFEADDGQVDTVTYRQLHQRVCRIANGIASLGYKKGDRAVIYMPMSIEAVACMQACARLGVIHSVVFGGFSARNLQSRIVDVGASLVLTADFQMRGGRRIPLKSA